MYADDDDSVSEGENAPEYQVGCSSSPQGRRTPPAKGKVARGKKKDHQGEEEVEDVEDVEELEGEEGEEEEDKVS